MNIIKRMLGTAVECKQHYTFYHNLSGEKACRLTFKMKGGRNRFFTQEEMDKLARKLKREIEKIKSKRKAHLKEDGDD